MIFSKSYFKKRKSSAQSLNFDWMWLVNELVLTFSAPIKCTKAQFNLMILSRVMPHTTYRQTDRQTLSYKLFFLTQGVSKRKDLIKISKVIFHIKPIPSHPWWECKKWIINITKVYTNSRSGRTRSAIHRWTWTWIWNLPLDLETAKIPELGSWTAASFGYQQTSKRIMCLMREWLF